MEKLAWTSQMSLGDAEMDGAHKAFVEQLGVLVELPDTAFGAGLSALVAAMETDFRHEEEQMERLNYAGLQAHREQHARVLSALHHVVPDVMKGDTASARHALELLPQWFVFHLSTMDTALAVASDMAGSEATAGDA